MDQEELENWRKAGKAAAEALHFGSKLIERGAVIREVCDAIDAKIIELGAEPAWPTQVAPNDYAAHYTPDPDDNEAFNDEVVCLDVGAHVDGFVGDNAMTIDLSGKHAALIKAARDALNNAAKILGVGVEIGKISQVIADTIENAGFQPVRNLSGHTISQWVIHDKPSIPNHSTDEKTKLEEGQVIAIEPFATTGAGMVYELDKANLFALWNPKPVRSQYAREVLACRRKYGPSPFTTRWITKQFGIGKGTLGLRELNKAGALHDYPPLVEKDHGLVAVWENTFLIGEKVECLTPWED